MKKFIILLNLVLSVIYFSSEQSSISQEKILKEMLPLLKKAKTYEKYKMIYARKAVTGEEIKTYTSDGYETKNTAKEGDFIVKNTTDAEEMYILTEEKFNKRYTYVKNLDNIWNMYQPIGKIKAVKVNNSLLKKLSNSEENFYIITSWNENMIVKKGDFLVSPLEYNEVYRIANKEFWETYQLENKKEKN